MCALTSLPRTPPVVIGSNDETSEMQHRYGNRELGLHAIAFASAATPPHDIDCTTDHSALAPDGRPK
ncbi:hypothetical protein WM40_01305 [Robbsia andropogonis]|uniref:Uncharacterized protein n=1 Tax=Robbsia andropogonis TaxID=28092 RepID=A0A0F5K5A3_9BURK|nr:hypothetical protein WM40_01305 [Robbsia andropogonis]